MKSFGQTLRFHRRQCRDELRGGLLTQERLGELLGHELGDAGYSAAAVSDWERDKSSIDKDDRLVLVSLVTVLRKQGGLHTPKEADALLLAGNYRPLNRPERSRAFPDWVEAPQPTIAESQPTSEVTEARSIPITDYPERRKQLILIQKVKHFWVEGVLEQSLQGSTLLDISHRRNEEAVEQPWSQVVGPAVYDSRELPISEKTIDVFNSADRALLILGDPGSGKTTALLLLARDLISRAEDHPSASIPIVLNLVSWAEKRERLSEWVVKELVAKYQIPQEIGREWLKNDELLLLLDGFDEVAAQFRPDCALAINHFRENHGLTGIVVCSRTDEYQATGTKLKLGGAIQLKPLTDAQVNAYLEAIELPTAGLRTAMQREGRLRETARSPLMLSIMRLTFTGAGEERISDVSELRDGLEAAVDDPRRLLFTTYIERMFQRRHPDPIYPPVKTKQWLAWLARKMVQHNQDIFFIEQLQPSWLPSRRWRWFYILATRLITGFFAGIAMWILSWLLRTVLPDVPMGLSEQVAQTLQLSQVQAELLVFLLGNTLLGMVVGFVHGLHFESRIGVEEERYRGDRQAWQQVATVGLAVGLLTTAALLLFDQPLFALAWGIAEAVLFGVISRYVDGRNYRNEVRLVEALGWSWPKAGKGLFIALILAAVAEIIQTSMIGYNGVSRSLITFGLAGLLLGGLRGRHLQESAVPNQGLWLSIRNAIIAALVGAFALGSVTLMIRDLTEALLMVLFMILFVGALYGGSNLLKHYLVRIILWYKGRLPRDCVVFLDHAAGLAFVRKIGGGYMFTHRLLQEHFDRYVVTA